MTALRVAAVVLLAGLALVGAATGAGAGLLLGGSRAAAAAGPTIELDRREVRPGEPVIVRLRGFTGSAVTIAVCGNLAKRGSADCNMTASSTEGLDATRDVTLEQLFVLPPPVPCPCVVRAAGTSSGQFAIIPFVLVGHPEAPVVSAVDGPLLDVDVEAEPSSSGLASRLRSALGGPTDFDVTVKVRNRSTEPLSNVAVTAAARQGLRGDAASFVVPRPSTIQPGATWVHAVRTRVPAPVVGSVAWEATATGAGPAVDDSRTTRHLPPVLVLLVVVLVADLSFITVRLLRRRRPLRTAPA